jgi:signal transduction histidine kinase
MSAARRPRKKPAAAPLRVLVVDDSPDDALLLIEHLRAGGYAPNWRRVATEADLLRTLEDDWDLVLADYTMPGFGGPRALALVRAQAPTVPFIFVSGTMGEETAVQALRDGAADYILKDKTARLPSAAARAIRESRSQRERERVEKELLRSQRLDSMAMLAAGLSHDLRNILTTAQLFADRLEGSADPVVARSAPKLIASISRAVSLCESTLAFGKAEEPPPQLRRVNLARLVGEVAEGEGLAAGAAITCLIDVPAGLMIRADGEQLYRVLSNLIRNARQAIEATGQPGTIEVSGGEDEQEWWIRVGDTGPGLPQKAREHLFAAFQGGARKGGTGLGLAIAAELVRGHGGRLDLSRSDADGTEFAIHLPKGTADPGM